MIKKERKKGYHRNMHFIIHNSDRKEPLIHLYAPPYCHSPTHSITHTVIRAEQGRGIWTANPYFFSAEGKITGRSAANFCLPFGRSTQHKFFKTLYHFSLMMMICALGLADYKTAILKKSLR